MCLLPYVWSETVKLETRFEIDDIVRYNDCDWRVWHIQITINDDSPEPEFSYLLIQPLDCDDDYSIDLNESEISKATIVRTVEQEFARLGIAL